MRGLDLQTTIMLLPVLLISLTVHECAHGLVAYWLGDNTAKLEGRLTLNPLRHIDPLGFIMLILVGYGWARPVPVDSRNFKDPKKDMAFCALAGPVSNMLIAFLTLLIWRLVLKLNWNNYVAMSNSVVFGYISLFVSLMVQYNCMLMLFNLIPVPPLDGSKLMYSVLPDRFYYTMLRYERYFMLALLILLGTRILSPVLSQGISRLMSMMMTVVNFILPI